jgi:hypothetical protein
MFPFSCSVSDYLHGYPLDYIRTYQCERAYVAVLHSALGIHVLSALRTPNGVGLSLIPFWVDMLQAGSAFWPSSCYTITITHEIQLP